MSEYEFNQAEREIWPTSSFARQIREIGVTKERKWKPKPVDYHDTTLQEADLAKIFLPKIILSGLSLRSEIQSEAWGGLLFRVLANKDYTKRCITYIYTWTRQRGAFSFWYSIAPPALLSFIALILLTNTTYLNSLIASTALGILFIAAGLRPYLQALISEKERLLLLHNETWLIFYGILFSVGLSIEKAIYSLPAIPATPIVFISLTVLILLLRIFENKIGLAIHEMDYEPVLVYLEKGDSEWLVSKIRFDRFHYIIRSAERDELINKKYIFKTDDGEKVKIIIDNNWHSMRLLKRNYELITYISSFVFYFFLADFFLAAISSVIGSLFSILALGIGDIVFVVEPIIFWITGLLYYAIHPFELKIVNFDPYHPMYHLTEGKLDILWNLKDESSRLVARLKLQDPFNSEALFWSSFRDDPLSIILFNILPRLDKIEDILRKKTSNNKN